MSLTAPSLALAIAVIDPQQRQYAETLAKRLSAPLLEPSPLKKLPEHHQLDYDMVLRVASDGLRLIRVGGGDRGIRVDFSSERQRYRSRGGSAQELVVRAMGTGSKQGLQVVDAAAGFGTDGFLLAESGCQVRLIERIPVVCALLEDGLKRGLADARIADIIQRMSVVSGDARIRLPALAEQSPVDVIYLDPMFPPRTRSAKVKLPMQYLQSLAGKADDADGLLDLSLRIARRRVVVKRPLQAAPLAGRTPDGVVKGKQCRYDIYACRAGVA